MMKRAGGRFLKFFGLVVSLGMFGCAAQNANRTYFEAEELVRQAMTKVGANHPVVTAAFDNLSKGKMEMLDARYDLAIRHFRESMKLSREVSEEKPAKPKGSVAALLEPKSVASPSPAPAAPTVSAVAPPANTSVSPVVSPIPAVQPPPPSLGSLALSKPESITLDDFDDSDLTDEIPKPNGATKKAAPKKKIPAKAVKKEAPAPKKEMEVVPEVIQESVDEKPITGKTVVVAPATPTLKPVPAVTDKKPKENLEKDEVKDSAAKSKVPPNTKNMKRKIPGSIEFISDDPSILPEVMPTLDQMSQFLLENPSTSLILQPILNTREAKTLGDSRFESIKAYLVGKGVPEDQVQLDPELKRGKKSEFQMFVLEH